MTRTTVLEVRSAPGAPGLLGAGIDVPAAGEQRPDWTLDLRGWVIGEQARAVAVEGLHAGRRMWAVPVDVERPHITAEHGGVRGDRIGFHSLCGTLSLPPEFELQLRAVLEDGTRAPVGVVRGRRAPLDSRFEPRRSPVLVTTLGRTGSMLLMRMLEAHPEVLVYRPYRFEQRVLGYWADVLLALAEPTSYIRQIAPAGDPDDPMWWLGRDAPMPWPLRDAPLQEWLGGEAVENLGAAFQERIEATYDQIVATTATADAALFAEKSDLRAANLLTELYRDSRELFLVRDFRDMIASILSFNAKRHVQGFGRDRVESDAAYVSSLGGWATGLVEAWDRRRGAAHLVRYEDLVTEPERTLGELLAYLGVDAGAAAVARVRERLADALPELDDHATSDGPEDSIGRWRRDLAPELVAECERALGPALAVFGYT